MSESAIYVEQSGQAQNGLVVHGEDRTVGFEELLPVLVGAGGDLGAVISRVSPTRKTDAVAYFNRTVKRLRAGKLGDLPAWDSIINDVGNPLCSTAKRNVRMAVISMSSDEKRRCFVVHGTADFSRTDLSDLAVKAAQMDYTVAGAIHVSDDLMTMLWSTWDVKRGVATGGIDETTAVQRLFDDIGAAAMSAGASDIHIDWLDGKGSVYFRVNGRVRHYQDMMADTARSMVSAAFNTMVDKGSTTEGFNERGLQDAVIERTLLGRTIRFRYAGGPVSPGGYDVTLRLVEMTGDVKIKTLTELGYSVDQQRSLHRATAKASGLILFLGSTGSGKSTSLASIMSMMVQNSPEKIYRSVEEPVEVRLPGVRQSDVPRQKGNVSAFNDTLRSILRRDPDVIMVGEIRDHLTADLAVSAVRTGHVVLSTLHAEGAALAFDRLTTLGQKRADLGSLGFINALVFQRLVPVLCPSCKERADGVVASAVLGNGLGVRLAAISADLSKLFVRSPDGCAECDGGIIGRTVCAEVLVPTPKLLERMVAQDSTGVWREWRRSIRIDDPDAMMGRTAFEHALLKMRQGLISPEDVEKTFALVDEPIFEDME